MEYALIKNQIVSCVIESVTSEGFGVARVDGRVIFVRSAARGDECRVKIIKPGKSVSYAVIDSMISPSRHRQEPDCPHFPVCGGCVFRHISYSEELDIKAERVVEALRRIGGFDIKPEAVLPSPETERYRNKSALPVGRADNKPVTGFYRTRTHDIIPVESCLLQKREADSAAAALRQWLCENPNAPVRHIVTRSGESGTLVCVVGASKPPPDSGSLVSILREKVDKLAGVVWNEHGGAGNAVMGKGFEVLWGQGYIDDRLCGMSFRISPLSFYQINRPQAESIYAKAAEYAGEFNSALDLYCGTGTLTLCLAARGGRVAGIEIVPEAVRDACENAARNSISTDFLCMDAAKAAETLRPDVITVDPPRKGMSPEAISAAVRMNPRRIVYISCDPATMARDIKLLYGHGYFPSKLTVADMFPRTAHVECVLLLCR